MKKIAVIFLFLVLVSSCAIFQPVAEESLPLYMRVVSQDGPVRTAAINEFNRLNDNGKKQEILNIIGVLRKEDDPYKRGKITSTLTELKAGTYAVIPFILAVKDNASIRDFREITAFLVSLKPAEADIPGLVEITKNGTWEGRMLAMTSLSVLSKRAETAMPEFMDMLYEFGADAGRYSRIFDCMAMINPEIAVAGVIKDITSPNGQIRTNAVEKLVELQAYLGSGLPAKKEIVPALIRALYSGDKALSEMAMEGLSKIEDPDARQAAENYLKTGRMAINMLYKLAGTTAEEVFKKQEQVIQKKLEDYYRSIGREDAVKNDEKK
jgi:hypothetical protein